MCELAAMAVIHPASGVYIMQFGEDATTEVVVSWHTTDAVNSPRAMWGTPSGGFSTTLQAQARTYRDANSGNEIRGNHRRVLNLTPDTDYVYATVHVGTCGPRRRAAPR
jgi:hypothetical protein